MRGIPSTYVGVAAAVLCGCSDMSSPTAHELPAAYHTATSMIEPESVGIDGTFLDVSGQLPGFAGYYLGEDGALVVRLKDRRQDNNARVLLRPVALLEAAFDARTSAEIRLESADYDFVELNSWRSKLRPLLGSTGVMALDVDERRNRVWVGVETSAARGFVYLTADRLGIPAEALAIEVDRMAVPAASLLDSIRPLPGGMSVTPIFSGSSHCTLGVNGNHVSGIFGFITASHCTEDDGTMTSTVFRQPYHSGPPIGTEALDATYQTGSPCPAGRQCRYADVAFIAYDSAQFGELAKIARPDTVCNSNCVDNVAAITIDVSNPRFTIYGANTGGVTVGAGLQKVGRRTGWTYGLVSQSCYDYARPGTNATYWCQTRVNGIAYSGDSGSPVFRFYAGLGNPPPVSIYGILHSACVACIDSGDPPYYIYSPWNGVLTELGTIQIK